MSGEASLINAAGDSVGRKVPVLGISIEAAETAEEEWDAKNAFGRAAHRNRSKQERIAANRAATIYSRRAILKAASTVAGQIPGYRRAVPRSELTIEKLVEHDLVMTSSTRSVSVKRRPPKQNTGSNSLKART